MPKQKRGTQLQTKGMRNILPSLETANLQSPKHKKHIQNCKDNQDKQFTLTASIASRWN